MKINCSTPLCHNMVEINGWNYFMKKLYSLFHGGDFVAFVFCPEHDERVSGGKRSDGDPNTNPDLNSEDTLH